MNINEPPLWRKILGRTLTTSQTELLPPTPSSAVFMASTKIQMISERFQRLI